MKSLNETMTWFPQALAPEHRAQLEALAGQAEWLSRADLEKLVSMMSQIHDIDTQRIKEAEEQAALEAHFEQQRKREIAAAVRAADLEKQIKRARIAAALGIQPDEVEM